MTDWAEELARSIASAVEDYVEAVVADHNKHPENPFRAAPRELKNLTEVIASAICEATKVR